MVNEQYINPDVNPFFNTFSATDVNSDGVTSPLDALLVINRLNAMRSGQALESEAWIYDDVSNDGTLSPLDALLVINQLSSGRQAAPLLENGQTGNAGLAAGSVDPRLPELGEVEGESSAAADAYFADYDEHIQSFTTNSDGSQVLAFANKGLRNIKRNFRQR